MKDKLAIILSALALMISILNMIPKEEQELKNGKSAYEIALEYGFVGSESEWIQSLSGKDGQDGKSAYEIAKENGYKKSEEEFVGEIFGTQDKELVKFTSELAAPQFYAFINENQDTIHSIKLNQNNKLNELISAFNEAFTKQEKFIVEYTSSSNPIWNNTQYLGYGAGIGKVNSIKALTFKVKAIQPISKITIFISENDKNGKLVYQETLDVNIQANEVQEIQIQPKNEIVNTNQINYYFSYICDGLNDVYRSAENDQEVFMASCNSLDSNPNEFNDFEYQTSLSVNIGHIQTTYLLNSQVQNKNYLYVQDYGIYPGQVDSKKMNELLELASKLNTTIQFQDGIYIFEDTMDVKSNTSIIGNTNTILKLSETSKSKKLINIGKLVDNVYLSHLYLQGNSKKMPTTSGQEIGLYINNALRINVENVEFSGFNQYGFYATQMSANGNANFTKMLQVTNCRFYDNYYGMVLGIRCEYSQILNCAFGNNYIGCLNQGGNNSYVSCIFNKNHIGFQMDSKNLSNPAHGGCNGCTFNHNGYPIIVNDCEIGWVFNGCQIFYGTIQLNECKGVIFNGSIFGSCQLKSTHSTLKNVNLISNSFFQTDSTKILAQNDGSTYVSNCLPDHLDEKEEVEDETVEDTIKLERVYYTQAATASSGAAENCYLGTLSKIIPANTQMDILDIAVQGTNPKGKALEGVDVWIGNADTMTVTERIAENQDIQVSYSSDLNKYVARIVMEKTYDYPVFVIVRAKRDNGIGIGYGYSSGNVEYLSTSPVNIGDVVSANTRYIAEIAVYKKGIE